LAEFSLKEWLSKGTLANLVAVIVVLSGTAYFIYVGDIDSIKWTAGFGLGWLFKELKT